MDWKKLGKKLLFLPGWLLLLLTAAAAAGLVLVFARGLETAPAAYAVYVGSFYTLCVDCVFCAGVLPGKLRRIKARVLTDPRTSRYAADRVYRSNVSLNLSLGINLAYIALNLLSWYLYRSWWFVCLAVYYGILSVMRFVLVRYVTFHRIGTDRRRELKRALVCGCVMLLLNLFLSAAVLMVVYQDRGWVYSGILIYVMALYTFYTLIHAAVELIRSRRFESPVMTTANGISTAAALVSLLNLETAMFDQFGAAMKKSDQQLMLMLTGAGISAGVIAIAVHTILRATKELKKSRCSENG